MYRNKRMFSILIVVFLSNKSKLSWIFQSVTLSLEQLPQQIQTVTMKITVQWTMYLNEQQLLWINLIMASLFFRVTRLMQLPNQDYCVSSTIEGYWTNGSSSEHQGNNKLIINYVLFLPLNIEFFTITSLI